MPPIVTGSRDLKNAQTQGGFRDMMRWIVGTSLQFRFLVVGIAAALMVFGMSSVQLIFEPGTNLMRARQLVQERLILSYLLPNVSSRPVMLNPVSATSRTMMIGVSSKKLSMIELSVLARWTIKPRLMGVPGVADVSIWCQG